MTGKFISFEGGEGCGKSTQARLLAEALGARDIPVALTREPGGTPGAEAIRQLLLDPALPRWEPRSEALLFAAARSDHVTNLIRPALDKNKWVICDRYVDSSRAYQGAACGLGDEDIMALHHFGSEGLLPDLTFLLDVDASSAAVRLAERDGAASDKIGGRGALFHAQVAQAFTTMTLRDPARFHRIDANRPAAEVHARIWDVVRRLVD